MNETLNLRFSKISETNSKIIKLAPEFFSLKLLHRPTRNKN